MSLERGFYKSFYWLLSIIIALISVSGLSVVKYDLVRNMTKYTLYEAWFSRNDLDGKERLASIWITIYYYRRDQSCLCIWIEGSWAFFLPSDIEDCVDKVYVSTWSSCQCHFRKWECALNICGDRLGATRCRTDKEEVRKVCVDMNFRWQERG